MNQTYFEFKNETIGLLTENDKKRLMKAVTNIKTVLGADSYKTVYPYSFTIDRLQKTIRISVLSDHGFNVWDLEKLQGLGIKFKSCFGTHRIGLLTAVLIEFAIKKDFRN